MNKEIIKTTWADYFKKYNLVLFNEYPEIIKRLDAWGEIPTNIFQNVDGEVREVFQWYHIAIDDYEAEVMAKETRGEVAPFYSKIIGGYILPVYHFGTPWDGVELELKREV